MNKRAIIILGAVFILIVGVLGFLIYKRSTSNSNSNTVANTNTTTTPVQTETPPPDNTPTTPASAAVRLTDAGDAIITPALTLQGNGIDYLNTKGQLFQTDYDVTGGTALLKNKRELSIPLKSSISQIIWPTAGNNFIAQFNTGSKPTWSVFQADKAAYADIPSQVYSIAWMPSGDKVAFVWVDGSGKATLNIGNPDTTGYQSLFQFYESDDNISVAPDGQHFAFWRTQTSDYSSNQIVMVDKTGKIFNVIVKDGYNTGAVWSPDSKKILFNKRDPSSQKMALWEADVTTGETKNLNVDTTLDKVLWSRDGFTVFAGVPNTGTAGQGLTQDTIYKINTTSGDQKKFEPGLAVDARALLLSTDFSILFFLNAQDNSLYYIPVN